MLAQKLLSAMADGSETLYVDDVFSAYTYTGNGSTQTITNGIDLAGKGGLVWTKQRSSTYGHSFIDSVRGITKNLSSCVTDGEYTNADRITALTSTGFSIGSSAYHNQNTATYVAWAFRKAPKFFDVITYTGDAIAGKAISHSLGIAPGMIIVKRTDTTGSWAIYHHSIGSANALQLDSTAASSAASYWNSTAPTASQFTLGAPATAVNASGGTYVAYLFAHDTSADGIVQCGSYVGNGAATGPTVTLGWEPQYVMIKAASAGGSWRIVDSARGMVVSGVDMDLRANTTDAEYSAEQWVTPTATGFNTAGGNNNNTGVTYIYLAIRRPNKPPTVGTQVYNAVARTGNSTTTSLSTVGFAPDLVVDAGKSGGYAHYWWDRLRGANKSLNNSLTAAEASLTASLNSFDQKGITVGSDAVQYINHTGISYINHFFKRAPGVFDVVCYTGNGGTNTQSHNLGAIPELMILKGRSTPSDWGVYVGSISQMYYKLTLQTTDAAAVNNSLFSAAPTASSFTLNTTNLNNNAGTYVAYLFATKAGISKVFNYTGNGSSQTINCGFTTGARFVLIKRTDIAGDWYVWDTVRGIIAGNDPHLSLNATAAEVTTNDSIDPDSSGFIVNQVAATNINVTSATYIGLAFA